MSDPMDDNDAWLTINGNPPTYVQKMEGLLRAYWADPGAIKAEVAAKGGNALATKYGVFGNKPKQIVVLFDDDAKFHLVLPQKKTQKSDKQITILAKGIIRCCADC